MAGWIKLHRKILDNPTVCQNPNFLAVWIYLLLNATHSEIKVIFNGNEILLMPGQLITGRKAISEIMKVEESKVQRILKKLENAHQIEQQTSTKNRLITILNWESYQQSEQQNEQQVNNKRTTSEQQVNTNKNVKKENNVNNNNNSCASNDDTTDIKEQEERAVCVDDICFENFEKIYAIYPLKKGKQDAYRHYTAWGKGTHACDGGKRKLSNKEMYLATKRYVDEMRELKKLDYLKHFSTFMNNGIVDYLLQNKDGD